MLLSINHYCLGAFAQSRHHAEQGIALYDAQQHHALAHDYGIDPGVHCLIYAALALWQLGYADQALTRVHEALTLAHEISHPFSLCRVLLATGQLYGLRRECHQAQEHAEACIALSTEHEFAMLLAAGTLLRGWVLSWQEHRQDGMVQMQQGLTDLRATGAEGARTTWLSDLAEVYARANQIDAGLQILDEAQALVQTTGVRTNEAEHSRLKGELLLQRSADHAAVAETFFHQALDIARSQHAKFWELRAATSLARLWQQQGKRQDAYDLLAPVYRWFTEGFDTVDLQEAKALLDALA